MGDHLGPSLQVRQPDQDPVGCEDDVELTFENIADLVATHQIFSALTVEKGPLGFPIPLHPGAERYYREIGVLD